MFQRGPSVRLNSGAFWPIKFLGAKTGVLPVLLICLYSNLCHLAPVVQTLDSAIHRINHYPADSVIGFPNTYPLDGDLSGG